MMFIIFFCDVIFNRFFENSDLSFDNEDLFFFDINERASDQCQYTLTIKENKIFLHFNSVNVFVCFNNVHRVKINKIEIFSTEFILILRKVEID